MLPRFSKIQDAFAHLEVPETVARQALTIAWAVLDPPDGRGRGYDALTQSTGYANVTIGRALEVLKHVEGFRTTRAGARALDPLELTWSDGSSPDELIDDEEIMQEVTEGVRRRQGAAQRQLQASVGDFPEVPEETEPVDDLLELGASTIPVLSDTTVALLRNPRRGMIDVEEAFAHIVTAGATAQEDFAAIAKLNERMSVPHTTVTVYTEALQERLDGAFTNFAEAFSHSTGYTMPSVRSTCPICLHSVVKPVCLDCGHLVCHACVTSPYLYRHDHQVKCPMCKRVGTWRKVYTT
jgi:hypothetical protein